MRTTIVAYRVQRGLRLSWRYDIGGYLAPLNEEKAKAAIAYHSPARLAEAREKSPAQVPVITVDSYGRCPACQGVGTLDEDPYSMNPAPCRYCQKGAA